MAPRVKKAPRRIKLPYEAESGRHLPYIRKCTKRRLQTGETCVGHALSNYFNNEIDPVEIFRNVGGHPSTGVNFVQAANTINGNNFPRYISPLALTSAESSSAPEERERLAEALKYHDKVILNKLRKEGGGHATMAYRVDNGWNQLNSSTRHSERDTYGDFYATEPNGHYIGELPLSFGFEGDEDQNRFNDDYEIWAFGDGRNTDLREVQREMQRREDLYDEIERRHKKQ